MADSFRHILYIIKIDVSNASALILKIRAKYEVKFRANWRNIVN